MSFWVHALCSKSVADVTPDELRAGIAKRLRLLTYLFCPDNEEDPQVVLSRLLIDDVTPGGVFKTFRLYYRDSGQGFIRIDRHDVTSVHEIEQVLSSRENDERVLSVKELISQCNEDIAFDLKARDVQGMGFPLAIAGAAYLVERAGGIIQSGAYSWMIPYGDEVKVLLEVDVSKSKFAR